MTIYLDYIFIENFLIDYILVKETSYLARKKVSNKRAMISSVIASIYVLIMVCLKMQLLNYFICKILLVVVIIYISFVPKKLNEYIKLMLLFFLISVISVGTITVITNLLNVKDVSGILKLILYVCSFFLSKIFMKDIWKIYKHNIKNSDLIYKVKIFLGNKTYEYDGFLDTGNSVYSYTYNVPVIFAELLDEDMKEYLKQKEYFNITTITLSSKKEKRAYVFDKVEITCGNETYLVKCAVVFEDTKLSKDNNYNMLLNYILYTQEMGGIKL